MRSLRVSARCLLVLAAGVLATPALAQQPNAYPITNVNLRAGPGTEYPIILTVPADAPITILGCLPDYTWCDSVFQNYRGWMRSIYLSGYYEGDYYLLRDYAPDLGYRPVTFSIDAYWDSYYRDEPFYGDRARWADRYGDGYVNEAVFYDRLSPHGSWIWIQGQYVWVPAQVERGWRPYTRGRWVYTNRGWTWVSNEPFGWATYHYGRWGFSDRVGWFWVPGNRWAPAWVSWRQSNEYLAWAPMPPSYDRSGISINISFGDLPDYYWSVVPSRDFLSDDLPRYYVRDRDRRRPALERTRPIGNTTIINNTTTVNNVVNVTYVEQTTNTQVVERQIATTSNVEQAGTIEGDAVEVYQPAAEETPAALAPPEPKTVEEVAATSETKAQGEGEETTEDMLAPPEVQDAAKDRKGRKSKAKAAGETGLPEGEIADAPPPAGDGPKQEPVPAEEVAAPEAAETKQPAAVPEEQPQAAPQETPEAAPDETPAAGPKKKSGDRKKPKDTAPVEAPEPPAIDEPQPAEPKDEAPPEAEEKVTPQAAPQEPAAEPELQPQEKKPEPELQAPAAPKAKEMKPAPKPKPAPQAPVNAPKPPAPPPEMNAPPEVPSELQSAPPGSGQAPLAKPKPERPKGQAKGDKPKPQKKNSR